MRFFLPVLLCWSIAAYANDNLFRDGSFETPAVKGRTPASQGGDPARHHDKNAWVYFKLPAEKNSSVTGGLTDEIAHSGKQSLYVRFNHTAQALQGVSLVSNFIPVVSGTEYEIGIWGRTDAKDLISAEGRTGFLKLEVDFFAADANESVGDAVYRVQPIPGGKDHPLYFQSDQWSYWGTKVPTPPGAVFAQITWRWETGSDTGELNGIMYFDDVTITGPQVPNPDMTPAPVQEETPAPDTTGTSGTAAGQ